MTAPPWPSRVGRTTAEVRHRLREFIDRNARRAGVAALYHTPVGVKQANQLFVTPMMDAYVSGEAREIDPWSLRMGIDALRDEFTMLEMKLDASPHVDLMRSLVAPGRELSEVYLARAAAGTLDWRPPMRVSPGFAAYLRRRFAERDAEFREAEQVVIRVAWIEDVPYLVDGKHRAALALVQNRPVIGESASNVFQDSYFRWLWSVMARRPHVYRRHLQFWERIKSEIQVDREAT